MYSFYFETETGFIDKYSSDDFVKLNHLFLDLKSDPSILRVGSIFEDDFDFDIDE